jgi:exodeoxyribonuclease VII small subunit
MAQKQPTTDSPSHSFESSIERLEQIVEEMEGDRLPLEKLIERFEEGSKLVKVCQEKLDAAERRVEIISRSASGKPQLAEFDPTAAQASPSAVASSPAKPSAASPAKSAASEEISLF